MREEVRIKKEMEKKKCQSTLSRWTRGERGPEREAVGKKEVRRTRLQRKG